MGQPDRLSPQQAAELCGVSRSTLLRWLHEGQIPHTITGGGWRRIEVRDLGTGEVDAGADSGGLDAGVDATVDIDMGGSDAATIDAGSDAGVSEGDGGCGCRTGNDGGGGLAMALMVAVIWRRRR